MIKKYDEAGNITIEATIVLTTVIFFFCFILNFGYIYRAQHFMSQVVQETGKNLSFSAYKYSLSKENSLTYAARAMAQVFGYESYNNDIRIAWNAKKYVTAAEKCLDVTMNGINNNKNQQLVRYNIKEYSVTKAEVDDVSGNFDLIVTYTVDLKFPVFGFKDITLHQETLNKVWV